MGLSLQMVAFLGGVGAVFAASPRMSMYWKNGNLKMMEWLCLGGAGTAGYWAGHAASVHYIGDHNALKNHWMAYSLIKSGNRWEGRFILKKAPMSY